MTNHFVVWATDLVLRQRFASLVMLYSTVLKADYDDVASHGAQQNPCMWGRCFTWHTLIGRTGHCEIGKNSQSRWVPRSKEACAIEPQIKPYVAQTRAMDVSFPAQELMDPANSIYTLPGVHSSTTLHTIASIQSEETLFRRTSNESRSQR